MTQFTRIDLSKNQLKFLPDDFGNLVNLRHLDLYNNQLENLPITFGKLTKLKYLDLKFNPLQLALQKIVGPCITSKDCCEAAKNIVPYYCSLEKKLEKEKRKKAEQDEKERKEEADRQREEVRLAKKAARKERVMLERQKMSEEGQSLIQQHSNKSETKANDDSQLKSPKSSTFISILKLFKVCLLIVMLATTILSFSLKLFPDQSKALISSIPAQYKAIIYETFKKINQFFFQAVERFIK